MNDAAEKFPDRAEYLGASELAAVLGLNPWRSPLDVYLEKRGAVPPADLSDNQAVHFGNVLEDVVAQEFSRRTGLEVRRDNRELVHPRLPFVRGHIDRRIVGQKAGLECKTAGIRMAGQFGEAGTDEVPPSYLIQCAAYLAITGFDEWHLAVLIAGNDFRTYRIPRDEELIAGIEARTKTFWACVQAGRPPEARSLDDIKALYPTDAGTEIQATADLVSRCTSLAEVRRDIKELEAAEDALKLEVQKAMGDHARLIGPDGKPLATWTTTISKRLDTKRLEADHPDLCAQYRIESAARRFLLKLK